MTVKSHITDPASGQIAEVSDQMDGNKRLRVDALQVGLDLAGEPVAMRVNAVGHLLTAPPGTGAVAAGFAYGTVATAALTEVAARSTPFGEYAAIGLIQRSVTSSDVADTAGGFYAQQIKIVYYDENFAGPYEEFVTLNGTTAVNTVSEHICYVDRIEVTRVGTVGMWNKGTITLYSNPGAGGWPYCSLAATINRTLWAHHYVAAGRTCYITGVSGHNNNAANGCLLTLKKRTRGGTTISPDIPISDAVRCGAGTQQATRLYGTPIAVQGPALVTLYVTPEGTPALVTRASFDFYEMDTEI